MRCAAALAAGLVAAVALSALPVQAAPRRVVSLNICTDELAVTLAAPGQVASVSFIARDPHSSAVYEQALALPVNHGSAEEVFALQPDLVLASEWTNPAALRMLERLGVPPERFAIPDTIEGVRAGARRMGALLGREAEAAQAVRQLDRALADARSDGPGPRVLFYAPNGYTVGAGTLTDELLRATGFRNLAAELGYRGYVRMPLERLVVERPDLVLSGQDYGAPALAGELLRHPAFTGSVPVATLEAALGSCAPGPLAEAVRALTRLRAASAGGA